MSFQNNSHLSCDNFKVVFFFSRLQYYGVVVNDETLNNGGYVTIISLIFISGSNMQYKLRVKGQNCHFKKKYVLFKNPCLSQSKEKFKGFQLGF